METTKTFVLLDLETSGLPKSYNPCKITEIALVATSRQHILDRHFGVSKENNEGPLHIFLPRVLNKVSLVVYPCKPIQPMASEVSGLTNEDLEYQRPFDEKLFEIIYNFIDRLEKPICLVAHNGNKFDFPLLQAELTKINKALPDHLFCADSLPGFRDVLTNQITQDIKPLNNDICYDPSNSIPKCGWSNDEYDHELVKAVELAEKVTTDAHSSFDVEELERKINQEMERIRKMNEQTPRRYRNPDTVGRTAKEIRVRRNLDNNIQPKRKFNLGALYESLTKKEFVNRHQAEGDALALLECLTAVGRPILEWLDANRIPFRTVKKMW